MEMTYLNDPSGFALRRVKIRRHENGFGFTLRHFIVYPPELYANNSQEDQSRNKKPLVKVTEPVDTIFVKSVVEYGPAERAGLCVGDRIVSVNGRTIFGKSYDHVVQLIQKSADILRLEVSPKQYDTLQLFFEETAYRPETNQRPIYASVSQVSGKVSLPDQFNYTEPNYHYQNKFHSNDRAYHLSNNSSSDSFFLNPGLYHGSMSSSYPHSSSSNPQLFSHLPRPTPYKSSSVWSSSGAPQQPSRTSHSATNKSQTKSQPQAYYPFNQDPSQSFGITHLWKIKEEPNVGAKSAESILTSAECNTVDFRGQYEPSQRSGSMECLNRIPAAPVDRERGSSGDWSAMRPGHRYDDGNCQYASSQRRESTGSIPNSNVQNAMVVTMSSTNSKIQSAYHPEFSDSGSSVSGSNPYNGTYAAAGQGYEHKMADRIRRSCEQKEEFLKRPNQPMIWAPLQSSSTAFPKELYAQPQKFEKIPWPPAHIVPTVTSAKHPIQTCHGNSGSFDSSVTNVNNISVVNVQHYPDYIRPSSRTTSPQALNTDSYDSDRVANPLSQVQSSSTCQPRSISPSWLEYAPRNRTTIVGSRKLHCDPPPNWNPDLGTLTQFSNADRESRDTSDASGKNANHSLFPTQDVSEVKLRNRAEDLDQETEKLVRRVSYLKATSSPIDMDRNSASPTSPTLSCGIIGKVTSPVADVGRRRSVANKLSAEFFPKGRIIRLKQFFEDRTQPTSIFKFSIDSPSSEGRGFGSLLGVRSPDRSEITREGQIHFKIRLGESKKGGYNRSWRQGWAQIRRSGFLYISKEQLSRESVTIMEDSVIIALSLRSGVSVEQAEDYSKRKHVLRIKTSYSSVDIASISENSFPTANAQPPSHSTAVEILVQADDSNDFQVWLQCLHTQLENNNYCNGNLSSFKGIFFGAEFCPKPKSLLTSFLPSPATSTHGSQLNEKAVTNVNNNSLQPVLNSNTPHNAASPKNKTWKGKVARQWKKVHNIIETGGDSKGSSPYSSMPPVGATFGINLEHCPPGEINQSIPRVIEYAIDVVERRGIDMVGLYRIPGNNASVATLTERLNKGEDPNPEKDPKWLDVHVVASLIKSFLRRLPDPLLTDDRYPAFIIAADDTDPEKCREKMQLLINDLPDVNYETLRAVVLHLKNVADHGESNRMDARNLAIVFGPTIVRTAEENVNSMVADMKNQCKIVELLISHADELFKERRLKEETRITSSSIPPPSINQICDIAENLEPYSIGGAVCRPSAISVEIYNTTENTSGQPMSPLPPSIESEIRASVLKAAMRKASQKSRCSPAQNIYGLPNKSSKKGKPIDEAGFIRSYAGLNEETEQRVRKFEQETRAMLSREDRSPHSSAVNVGTKPSGIEDFKINRLKLDDELQRAKDDLENDDIYDQLADNPSSIVHHRDRGLPMFGVSSGTRNLSSSSLSSSNSNGTVPPTSGVIIQKLGPAPFKSTFSNAQSLPPKPPQLHNSGSSFTGPASLQSKSSLSSSSSPISPLRRVSSMDRFGTVDVDSSITPTPDVFRNVDRKLAALPFVPKHFGGSLDSLKEMTNPDCSVIISGDGVVHRNGHSRREDFVCEDFSPRSSEGSDLVTSLSKALDMKLENLRSSHTESDSIPNIFDTKNPDGHQQQECRDLSNDSHRGSVSEDAETPKANTPGTPAIDINLSSAKLTGGKLGENGRKKSWRRNSMIERRSNRVELYNGSGTNGEEHDEKSYYRNPSLHRFSGEFWPNTPTEQGADHTVLTKEAKTATNKLTRGRDCRRRHSLSGGGDILSLAYADKTMEYEDFDGTDSHFSPSQESRPSVPSNECITAAITRADILESHV